MRYLIVCAVILTGCYVENDNDDKVIGTLCLINDRLEALEKNLNIDVPKERKMTCQNYSPYASPTKLPR